MSDRTTVLLADDHVLVRQGIRQFLEDADDIEVVAEADDGEQALLLALQLRPQVVILDIRMPKLSGVEVTRRLKAQLPAASIVILTAYDDDPYVTALLQAGANGYVLKTATSDELVRAVRLVSEGKPALSPEIAHKVVQHLTGGGQPLEMKEPADPLTPREIEVLRLASRGLTNREIGQALNISHRTVQGHLASIYVKLGVSGRTEAATEALRLGWIVIE